MDLRPISAIRFSKLFVVSIVTCFGFVILSNAEIAMFMGDLLGHRGYVEGRLGASRGGLFSRYSTIERRVKADFEGNIGLMCMISNKNIRNAPFMLLCSHLRPSAVT